MAEILNYNAERLARARADAHGCTLGKENVCEALNCKRCGWQADEAARRKRLPMHRNQKGLWEKRVGKREAWGERT